MGGEVARRYGGAGKNACSVTLHEPCTHVAEFCLGGYGHCCEGGVGRKIVHINPRKGAGGSVKGYYFVVFIWGKNLQKSTLVVRKDDVVAIAL